jgi:hypothetical protein
MEHYFNTDVAKDCGIEEAILLHNFHFWLSKNAANEKHFHDGLYWFYNSKKAFVDLFPYMNETKIFRSIKNLEERGFVVKGNYNTDKWDRTNWYAITKFGLTYLQTKGYPISGFYALFQNDTFDSGKMNDAELQSEQSILINNTYTNTYTNKKDKEESLSKKETDSLFEECWIAYQRKGSKKKSKEQWNKLSNEEMSFVPSHIKAYTESRERQYRKDFERYLRDKTFNDLVSKGNRVIYDPTKTIEGSLYMPQGRGIWFNEDTKSYWIMGTYDDTIYDGYTNDTRPDGATLTRNNGLGTIIWKASIKKWENV